ncbi:MAG: hypothetical protein ACR2KG_03195 [Nocardioidaceae bacterium]
MELDRRQFLASGLVSLASVAVSTSKSWAAEADNQLAQANPAQSHRFAGDPGRGNLYYGAAVMYTLSLPALERKLHGKLTVRRSYFLANEVPALLGRVNEDHANRRFPMVSTKLPGTWADVAVGRYDAWLSGLLRNLKQTGKPVMLSLHHEPEDDIGPRGMTPGSWVAMQRHAISMAGNLAPNTTIVPILMQWTFDPNSGRKPSDWLVSTADVFGLDCYNDWTRQNGIAWTPFVDKASMVLPYTHGKPIAIGEYGCRTDHSRPGRAAKWMTDAFEFCSRNNVIAMSYYDSNLHCPWGTFQLDRERTQAMRRCLHRPNVARLR